MRTRRWSTTSRSRSSPWIRAFESRRGMRAFGSWSWFSPPGGMPSPVMSPLLMHPRPAAPGRPAEESARDLRLGSCARPRVMPQSRQPRGEPAFNPLFGLVLGDPLQGLPERADPLIGVEQGFDRPAGGGDRLELLLLPAERL